MSRANPMSSYWITSPVLQCYDSKWWTRPFTFYGACWRVPAFRRPGPVERTFPEGWRHGLFKLRTNFPGHVSGYCFLNLLTCRSCRGSVQDYWHTSSGGSPGPSPWHVPAAKRNPRPFGSAFRGGIHFLDLWPLACLLHILRFPLGSGSCFSSLLLHSPTTFVFH